MVAAENGALPGGKVGGIADVIRDIPQALAAFGHQVEVVTPGYQRFSLLSGARRHGSVEVAFRNHREHVELFQLPITGNSNVRCWALEHPLFAPCGPGKIYCDDPPESPFASDASKFALFCLAVAEFTAVEIAGQPTGNSSGWGQPDAIHLHDWHGALVALLAKYAPQYRGLSAISLVYTIHNLSLQGIRPIAGDESSLQAWFPWLAAPEAVIQDPRYPRCINPVRTAIKLCDRIQTVSPMYANEIQIPSNPETGYIGGEGLEDDLRQAAMDQRLVGILNGCEYPQQQSQPSTFSELLAAIETQLNNWIVATPQVDSCHLLALRKLDLWRHNNGDNPGFLVTSVGRLTNQKINLLLHRFPDDTSVLDKLLTILKDKGRLVIVGSGDSHLEQQLSGIAVNHDNLLFLKGYSETLADQLYASGDLFLMPSSFEPCGISQMLAMRASQPCLVHHVGGLADTVIDNHNGFAFDGLTSAAQAQNLVARFSDVLALVAEQPEQWRQIRRNAASTRFLWSDVARQYLEQLYGIGESQGQKPDSSVRPKTVEQSR